MIGFKPFGATASIKLCDETAGHRIYNALGDVQKFEPLTPEPVDDTTGDPTRFAYTVVEAGAGDTLLINSATAGNWLTLTTAANEYDGANVQAKGEAFKLTVGKPLYFGAKLAISDATESDLLVGLCETKTDLLNTSVSHAVNSAVEGLFFLKLDGATTIYAKAYEGGSETTGLTAGAVMTTAARIYEIVWDGVDTVHFYLDGVIVGSAVTSLPNGDLTPSINFRAGAAAAKVAEIHWVRCFQARS